MPPTLLNFPAPLLANLLGAGVLVVGCLAAFALALYVYVSRS